jgi:hypothetical protein
VTGKYQGGAAFSYRSATVAIDEKGGTQVVAPAAKPAEPVAEAPPAEPAKTEPAAEEKPQEAPAEAPAEAGWKKWALYGGLVVGNLLILGLGFFAYRMIMGGGKSKVLEESDEEDDEDGPAKGAAAKSDDKKAAEKGKKEEGKPKKKVSLDLPDDAIDIDPAADKKK